MKDNNCTSKPYTGAMRGTVQEPHVNIGADQKFSPIEVFNKKKGDKPWNFNRLINYQTTPFPSLQNGQVTMLRNSPTDRWDRLLNFWHFSHFFTYSEYSGSHGPRSRVHSTNPPMYLIHHILDLILS